MIRLLGFLGATAATMIFGFANLHLVQLNTVFGEEIRASLVILLGGAFTVGFVAATVFGATRALTTRKRLREPVAPGPGSLGPRLPPPPQVLLPHPNAVARRRTGGVRFWR